MSTVNKTATVAGLALASWAAVIAAGVAVGLLIG